MRCVVSSAAGFPVLTARDSEWKHVGAKALPLRRGAVPRSWEQTQWWAPGEAGLGFGFRVRGFRRNEPMMQKRRSSKTESASTRTCDERSLNHTRAGGRGKEGERK